MKLFLLCFCLFFILLKVKAQCPPALSVSLQSNTLTCFNPTILATGSSTTPNTVISWTQPFPPPTVAQPTLLISPDHGGMNMPPYPLFYDYTVTATNTLNTCSTTSIITIYLNFKSPISSPSIISTPTFICDNNTVILSKGNSTVTSGVAGASANIILWESPVSGTSTSLTFNANSSGIYSLTMQDSYNGCTKTGTISVVDNRPSFSINGAAPTSSVSCDGSINITSQVTNGYSISISSGSLAGMAVSNLCYGKVIVCMTNTSIGCKKCDSLMINAVTAIQKNNLADEFILYPNPTNSTIYIQNEKQKNGIVKVFNVEGREIESLPLVNDVSTRSATTIIENLHSGIYFVEINIEGAVMRKKVVVVK